MNVKKTLNTFTDLELTLMLNSLYLEGQQVNARISAVLQETNLRIDKEPNESRIQDSVSKRDCDSKSSGVEG